MIVYKHKKVHVIIFYICYFLLIAIPHTTNIGFDISRFININIGGKTIFIPFILIVLNGINTVIYLLRKKKIYINKVEFIIFLIAIVEIIYVILGYSKYGKLAFSDYTLFLFHISLFLSSLYIEDKNSLKNITKITLVALITNCIVLVVIKFIFSPMNIIELHDISGKRFGVANQSLYIFSMPLLFYYLYENKLKGKRKIVAVISFFLMLYLVMLNASRSVMGCIGLASILIYLEICIQKRTDYNRNEQFLKLFKNIIFVMVAFITIISALKYLKESNHYIFERIISIFKNDGDGSLKSRELTNKYYLSYIKENLFGYGFGMYMPLIAPEGFFYQLESFYSDNLIYTLMIKGGLPLTVLIIFFVSIIYYYNICLYKKSKDKIYMIYLITIPFLLFNCSILCTQVIHSVPVFTFVYVYFGMIVKQYKNYRYNNEVNK